MVAGRKPYKWTDEEKQRLITTYKKHGWQMGYFMDFGCSYMTCKRKLQKLGLIE